MNVGTLYANLLLATGEFDKGLTSAGARLRAFGAQVTQAGRDIMVATAPVAALGGAAVDTGMKFESAFAKIEGLVGIAGEDLQMLKDRVLQLSGTTAKSPTELAEALYYLTSSGMSAAEAANVLEVAAKGATVGLGTTQTVAKAAAFAINAYRDSGLTASQATDILTAAVKYGTIEADEMAPVLGRLLPIASELDISYNQVAGTLAVMSRTGLDAAEAATSMSSIFSNLVKPSVAARQVLASVGLSMTELREVASREPDGVIQVYRLLNKTLTEEQFSVVVPNVRAMRGAMNFLAQETESVDEVMRGVAGSAGALDHAFGITSQTAEFQLNQTLADLQVGLLELWEAIRGPLIGALKDLARFVKDAAKWFSSLDAGTKDLIVKVGALLVALGPLLILLGTMIKVVGVVVSGFGSMVGAIGAVLKLIPLMLGPVGAVVLAVGLLVTTLIDFATASDRGREAARAMVHELSEAKGGFKTAEEAADGAAEAFEKIAQKSMEARGEWHNIALDMLPFIGAVRQSTRDQELMAAATEVQIAAQKELDATLLRSRIEEYNKKLEAVVRATESASDTMRELGPDFEMTDQYVEILAERFGLSADAIRIAWGQVAADFEEQAATIQEVLESLPPDFEMTDAAAQEMATAIGVSAEDVIEKWEAMQAAINGGAVDMNNALGEVSTVAEREFTKFSDATRYSMDDVQARIDTLKARLIELDKEDLASLGPSAAKNWADAREATQTELDKLVEYIESGGQSVIAVVEEVEEAVRVSATGIASALGGLAGSSDDAFKAFKKSAKDGGEGVEKRIDKLTTRLDKLNKVDLGKLGPAALAAWMLARTNTETELGNLTFFVNNKGEIIESVLPDAIANSTEDSKTEFETLFGLVDGQYTGMTETAETEAPKIANALTDAIVAANPKLEAEFGAIANEAETTFKHITGIADDESTTAADALPEALRNSKNPLVQALVRLTDVINLKFGNIEDLAGTYGTNTGDSYVDNLSGEIRGSQQQINSAVRYATRGLQAFSPPKFGPLKDITKWARSTARAWVQPFQDTVRAANLLADLEPAPMLARIDRATMPGLAPAMRERYDHDWRGREDRGGTTIGDINIGTVQVPEGTKDARGFARSVVDSIGEELGYQGTRISEAPRR